MPHARFRKLSKEKQQAILDAAAEEFVKGYDQASYNRIIERSGVSKGSMYYYFEGKHDLYNEVLLRMAAGFYQHIGSLQLVPDAATFWQQAEEMSVRAIEFYADNPTAAGLLRSLMVTPPAKECQETVSAIRGAWEAWWAAKLKVGQECGAIRTDLPSSLMIRLLVATCHAVDSWCIERIDQLSREDWREVARMLAESLQQMGDVSAEDEGRRHLWQRFHE